MLEFNCPASGHKLNLKAPKPGRFRPKCSKYQESFQLVIDESLTSAQAERLVQEPATKITKPSSTRMDKGDDIRPAEKQPASATKQTPKHQPTQIDDGEAAAEPGDPFSPSSAAMPKSKRLGGYRLVSELERGGNFGIPGLGPWQQ